MHKQKQSDTQRERENEVTACRLQQPQQSDAPDANCLEMPGLYVSPNDFIFINMQICICAYYCR